MEELLSSASFLLPSFRRSLSSPLMYAYSPFSGKNILVWFYPSMALQIKLEDHQTLGVFSGSCSRSFRSITAPL